MIAALAIAGTLILATGLFLVARSRATRKWPSTHGEILSSRVHWASGSHEAYRAELRYWYSINAERLEGVRVSLFDKPWLLESRELAEWRVARYPAGKRIEVFYNPRDPRRAVLEHRESMAGVTLAMVGVVFLAATLATALGA